jgi:Protein of unknown function (DUF4235)
VPVSQRFGWKVITLGSGALAGLATQRLLETAWTALHSAIPPPMPADRRSSWADALSWAIATGVGVGVARLLAIRAAAMVWEATTHEPPPEPGLEAQAPN